VWFLSRRDHLSKYGTALISSLLPSCYNPICVGTAGLGHQGCLAYGQFSLQNTPEKKPVGDHPSSGGMLLPLLLPQQPNLLFLPGVLPKLCQHAKPVRASEAQYVASPPSPGLSHPHTHIF